MDQQVIYKWMSFFPPKSFHFLRILHKGFFLNQLFSKRFGGGCDSQIYNEVRLKRQPFQIRNKLVDLTELSSHFLSCGEVKNMFM